jgi:hypothetical protein
MTRAHGAVQHFDETIGASSALPDDGRHHCCVG